MQPDPQPVTRAQFNRRRSLRRHEDRKLVAVAAAKLAGVKVSVLASAMRREELTVRLTTTQVQLWLDEPVKAPEWFTAVLAKQARLEAEQEAKQEAEQQAQLIKQEEAERLRAERHACRLEPEVERFVAELRALAPQTRATKKKKRR